MGEHVVCGKQTTMACTRMAYITKRWRIMALSRSFSSFNTPEETSPEEEYDGYDGSQRTAHTICCTHTRVGGFSRTSFRTSHNTQQTPLYTTYNTRVVSFSTLLSLSPSLPPSPSLFSLFSLFLLPLYLPPSSHLLDQLQHPRVRPRLRH